MEKTTHINSSSKSYAEQLEVLRDEFFEIKELPPQNRGYRFEGLIIRLLEISGLNARAPYRNVGEQIDGSFQLYGHTYLIEAKWEKNKTSSGDLRKFHATVTNKAEWTRGLFISFTGFTEDSKALFATLAPISFVCMDGNDLEYILNGNLTFKQAILLKLDVSGAKGKSFELLSYLVRKNPDFLKNLDDYSRVPNAEENKPIELLRKLPIANRETIILERTIASVKADANVNSRLIKMLFNEMTAYGVEKPRKGDWRALRKEVVDGFPVPVGEQLRILFQSTANDEQRLKQLVITYQTALELLCYTLLSQLWDARLNKTEFIIHKDYVSTINNFLTLRANDVPTFDYVSLTASLLAIFRQNKVECFVHELSDLRKSLGLEGDIDPTYFEMEKIKRTIFDQKVKPHEVEPFCLQADAYLGTILKKLAFWVKYQMTTIKRIEVIKRRYREPDFYHNKVDLDRATEGLVDETEAYKTFTDSSSVLLLKNNSVATYFSLSPFVIDENALTGDDCSKLFFYSHYLEVGGKTLYIYTFCDNREETLIVSDDKYPQIKELMDEFRCRKLWGISS